MKATRHYATAPGDHNDFTEENEVEGDHLIQQPEYLKAYALYQSKFGSPFGREGKHFFVTVPKRTLHQEPMAELQLDTRFNGQLYRRYLGPLLHKEHPEVELYFGTFNCNRMADLDRVMQGYGSGTLCTWHRFAGKARTLWARYMTNILKYS